MTEGVQGRRSSPIAAVALLSAAAAAWVFALQRMHGMDMGPGTRLGSFSFFLGTWTVMMAAMMLPSAVPAAAASLRAALVFAASYIAVWASVGVAGWGVDRAVRSAHPAFLAWSRAGAYLVAAAVIAAGLYEFTPLKRACLRRCRAHAHASSSRAQTGLRYGVNCLGCTAGLMLILFALGVMSVTWMLVVAALVFLEKVPAVGPRLVAPIALLLIVAGTVILLDPSLVLAHTKGVMQ